MGWKLIAEAVRTRLATDTGAGGLFNSTSPLVNATYFVQAAQESAPPYLVMVPVSETDLHAFNASARARQHLLQVSIFTDQFDGAANSDAIAERLHVMLHRWTPTITGYVVSEILHNGCQGPFIDQDSMHRIEEFAVFISQ